jgi:hypothetical protein
MKQKMIGNFFLVQQQWIQKVSRALMYEWDYALRRRRPIQLSLFTLLLIGEIISGLGDVQSFFPSIAILLPDRWDISGHDKAVLFVSVGILAALYFLVWLREGMQSHREATDLAKVTQEHIVPLINTALKRFKTKSKKSYELHDDIRISVFVPVRKSFMKWRLKMVCKTDDIPNSELEASLAFDEGVLGYTFLRTKKHCMEYVNISAFDSTSPPSGYRPLSSNNQILISSSIQGVLVAGVFQEGSIAGMLAIDTDNSENLEKMESEYGLHSDALDWILAKSEVVKLLWRMKNNV